MRSQQDYDLVCEDLVYQFLAVRGRGLLPGARLAYFRRAIARENFRSVVELLRKLPGYEMFSTLAEIEAMEKGVRSGYGCELIEQCCMILYFMYRGRIYPPEVLEGNYWWIFRYCGDLKEVACLRNRLYSKIRSSYVQRAINIGLLQTIEDWKEISKPTWQELLLIIKVCKSLSLLQPELVRSFNDFLHNSLEDIVAVEVPDAAVSFMLSSVVDSACNLIGVTRHCVVEEKLILRLLELGASLMVTSDESSQLFENFYGSLLEERAPRVTEDPLCFSTALKRILERPHSDKFVEDLKRYACCSLDASGTAKLKFGSKLSALKCLAAKEIPLSQLRELPLAFKRIVLKHGSIGTSGQTSRGCKRKRDEAKNSESRLYKAGRTRRRTE